MRRWRSLHEASIAQAIIEAAEEALREHNIREDERVEAVEIEVGALALVDVESLRFALEVLSKGTRLEGARFELRVVTPRLRCRSCGYEWSVDVEGLDDNVKLFLHFAPDKVYEMLKCPRCGSRDIEVVEGMDVKLKSIKLVEKRRA